MTFHLSEEDNEKTNPFSHSNMRMMIVPTSGMTMRMTVWFPYAENLNEQQQHKYPSSNLAHHDIFRIHIFRYFICNVQANEKKRKTR